MSYLFNLQSRKLNYAPEWTRFIFNFAMSFMVNLWDANMSLVAQWSVGYSISSIATYLKPV